MQFMIGLAALFASVSFAGQSMKQLDDGLAEVDAYALTRVRYGEQRKGCAIAIWVMEPFSRHKQVKLDNPKAAPADAEQVMKLNLIERFRTGVYDYSLMTSGFFAVHSDRLAPFKVVTTAQEWCGTVSMQLNVQSGTLRAKWASYFESEGDGELELAIQPRTLFGDAIPWLVRSVFSTLQDGEYPYWPSNTDIRLAHVAPALGRARVENKPGSSILTVPGGTIKVRQVDVHATWSATQAKSITLVRRYWVEVAFPNRLVAWEGDVLDGPAGVTQLTRWELSRSERLAYWTLNKNGQENTFGRLCGIH